MPAKQFYLAPAALYMIKLSQDMTEFSLLCQDISRRKQTPCPNGLVSDKDSTTTYQEPILYTLTRLLTEPYAKATSLYTSK